MKLLPLIIIILLVVMVVAIIIARVERKRKRTYNPKMVYDETEIKAEEDYNMQYTYSETGFFYRLFRKYESICIWIKLRERYGRRLISYRNDTVDSTDFNRSQNRKVVKVVVKYIGEDMRPMIDVCYISFNVYLDMSLVTEGEYNKKKNGEEVKYSVTLGEFNAMRNKLFPYSITRKLLPNEEEKIDKAIISEKERVLK